MRLSTVFVSTVLVLAGTSAALPVERENMLVARFANSDFHAKVEARAYDKGLELYARGSAMRRIQTGSTARGQRQLLTPGDRAASSSGGARSSQLPGPSTTQSLEENRDTRQRSRKIGQRIRNVFKRPGSRVEPVSPPTGSVNPETTVPNRPLSRTGSVDSEVTLHDQNPSSPS